VKFELGLRRRANLLVLAASRALGLRSQEGSTLVEFAIIVPLLMACLTGTCSVAMAFYSLQEVSNACSAGVLSVGSNRGYSNDDDPCALARSTVTGMLQNWNAANFGYQIRITDSTGTVHYYPGSPGALAFGGSFTCASDSQYLSPNEPVALTVSYKYTWVPILGVNWSSLPPLSATQGASVE
jgi:Flp pilus assembly protein TadG